MRPIKWDKFNYTKDKLLSIRRLKSMMPQLYWYPRPKELYICSNGCGDVYWQFSLGRCSCSGIHGDLPKHSAALRSHSQMNISHALFLPEEDKCHHYKCHWACQPFHLCRNAKSGPDILTATGDFLVGLIAAVVVNFSVGVVQDAPALRMLHGVAVTLVMYLAAPKQSLHHTFETGCTAAQPGIPTLKYWPVQIIHRCAGASVSAVAAVVGVVKDGPAVGLHTQDHLPELVEGQVVQRLTWKHEKKQLELERCTSLRDVSRIWDVSLTDGEACSHEEHNLEGIHPGVCQRQCPLPTSTSLYIMCGTLVLLCQLFTLHVITHAPKCKRTLREPTWDWSFGSAEITVTLRNRGPENITKKNDLGRKSVCSASSEDAEKTVVYPGNRDRYHTF